MSDTAEGDSSEDTGGDTGGDAGSTQTLRLEGLSAPVEITFDKWGIPHIRCQETPDCYAAQGYVHANHRFFEMDLVRRRTLGELSRVVGGVALGSDKRYRKLMTTRRGEPLEDAYYQEASDRMKSVLQAYAKGVNAWIDDMENGDNGATLTGEYDHPLISKDNIRDWEPQDTIALYLQLAYQLSESAQSDLARFERMEKLDPKVASDLFTTQPGPTSNILDTSGVTDTQSLSGRASEGFDAEAVRGIQERLGPASDAIAEAHDELSSTTSLLFGRKDGQDGSNNWVLGPQRTKNDSALLANDPHLSLNNPAIWYYVELDSKTQGNGDLHVAGASIPAVPGIVVGHNEDVAWGVTTARLDLADAYVEKLAKNGEAVERNGSTVDIIEKEYEFKLKGGGTRTETFEWVPGHGPIISKDMENDRAVTMKWVAQKAGNDLDFLPRLMRAGNAQEALDALEPIRTINQNWVIADREGSIAWRPEAALPKRPWASSEDPNWLPVPGQGDHEWDGYVSGESYPQMVDPPNGFIATANNDFDGSYTDGDATNDGHTPWQRPPAMSYRHERIVERIEEGGNEHTPQTMLDIQSDTHSLHGEALVPEVVEAAEQADDLSSSAQKVLDALKDWNYTCPTGLDGTDPEEASKASGSDVASESIGCAAFHVMLPYLTEAIFDDELRPIEGFGGRSHWYAMQAPLYYVMHEPQRLENGDEYFDDETTNTTETRSTIVAGVLETTATKLEKVFGSATSDDWRWGRIHTVTFTSFLAEAGLTKFNNGPYANDGGFFTVDVANPTGRGGGFDDDFSHPNGPSLRFVARLNDEGVQGWFQLPGGQDHHRDSKWYGSLVDEWLRNEPHELRFGADEVEDVADEQLRLAPAQ